MSKAYFEKNQKEKEKQNKTAGSSKTVSNPTVKTTQSQTAKKTTQKSQPTYWQANQQTQNKQATQQARKDLNISQPKKQALTASQKRQMQTEARAKRNKYAEAERKAKQYNAETSYDYSQANEGIKAMFRKGESVGAAMNKYAHANQKALAQDRANRLGQAELAQAVVDRNIKQVEDNEVLNVLSDINRSTLGGVTSGIGGLIRTGGNLARGYAGLTGNQELAKKVQKADRELGLDEALRNVNEDNIVANNMVGKVAQSIGNMVPTIGATLLSGGSNAAGLGLMGASVFGNEGAQALDDLSQDGELSKSDTVRALTSGALKAGNEVLSEQISSIFPGVETFAFMNPNNLLGQAAGEAFEEMYSSAWDPFIDAIANPEIGYENFSKFAKDWAGESWKNTVESPKEYLGNIGESGLLGAATSLAMGGGANASEYLANKPVANRIEEYSNNWQPYNGEPIPEIPVRDNTPAEPTEFVREVNPEAVKAAEIEEPELAWNQYEPSKGGDTYQIANENGEVFEEQEQKPGITERIAEKVKSLFGNKKIISDKAMDYILKNYTEAVTSSDPQTARKAAGEVIQQIANETEIPAEIVARIKGGRAVNQTAERLAEGERIGMASEESSELTAKENLQKIQEGSADTTYDTTMHNPLRAIGKENYEKAGSMDKAWANFMQKPTSKSTGEKVTGLFKGLVGINTDYGMAINLAEGQYLHGQMEAETNRLLHEIEGKGYTVNPVTSFTGDTTYQLMKDGKIVDPPDMRGIVKELTEHKAKETEVELKLKNIGHNLGTFLGMFRADSFSPGAQIKEFNQFVESLNKQLEQKFGKQLKSGELQRVKLNEDLMKQFLEETDDQARTALIQKMGQDLADQVPHTFWEKLDTFRYNNLLFNPLTWIRNTIGNAGQSTMANAKDMTLYALESYMKARGRVRYNNIDFTNPADYNLFTHTELNVGKTLTNDFADAQKSKNAKNHLKSLGYDGSLLNTMAHYKGKTFQFSQIDAVLNQRLTEKVANNAKEAGYTVKDGKLIDKNGNEISDKAYRELLNKSFKSAKKQWLSSEDLRMAKQKGIGKGMAHKTQRQLFWDEGFNILNPQHESLAGMLSDGSTNPSMLKSAYKTAHRNDVFSNRNPFGWTQNKISHAIDYAMNEAPFMGDDWWIRSGYSKNMARMLDSRGLHAEINDGEIELFDKNGDKINQGKADAILNEINADAYRRAQEDTYHDANELANILNEIERMGSLPKIVMNAVQPFIKTPLNITRRAIEYSPIGLITSLSQLNQVKAGKMSASTWLNNMSKGATGATAMAIGFWLASMGILRAQGDEEDETITRFEQSKGLQPYSIQIPGAEGWSATLDWLAPGIAPFLLGAAVQEEQEQYVPREENESALKRTWNLLGEGFTDLGTLFRPIADTTMLSGLMDTLSAVTDDEGNFQPNELMATITQNYIRQLTPVLGSKIAGIIDPVKYSTASDSFFDRQLRATAINMRLLDMAISAYNGEPYLQPQLDLNGKPIETQDYGLGAAGRAFTNLLNPATVKNDTRDKTDLELERLYYKTNQKYIIPYIHASVKEDGVYTKLTPEERTEFNEYFLPNYKAAAKEFIGSMAYNDYDDDQRANILNAMANHYFAEAKAKYLGRIIPNADSVLTKRDKAADFVNGMGVSIPHFYGYINTDYESDSDGNHINNTKAMKIRAQMEADGIWDNIVKSIDKGTFEPGDFGLNKLVTYWDTEDFTYYYTKMLNGVYDGKLVSKKKR